MRSRVVGTVIAIALVIGCSSPSGWRQLDTRAEAICSDGNDAIAAVGSMPVVAGRRASAYALSLSAIQARIARRLADLEVPANDRRVFAQLVARLEFLVVKSREYATQMRTGEDSLDGEMREAAVDAQNAALELGLTECARFGLP